MEGMGYRFCGHYGSHSLLTIKMESGARGFYTAHTREHIRTAGEKLLCLRDPAEVALSLFHYVRSRKDHYLHRAYRDMSREEAMRLFFVGDGATRPLAERYLGFIEWAEQNGALIFDFADVRKDFSLLARLLGESSYDESRIAVEVARPNPTKRESNGEEEKAFLGEFVATNRDMVRPCYAAYERAKELGRYAL